MPAKPRLFFSHSTENGTPERKILTGLVESLRPDYAILLDRETLVPGEDWRSTLNVWIGSCDAVVILITPQSVASEFCQYEWSILSYRRQIQPKFLVVPIYHGVTPQQIAGRPHQISEIAGYFQYESLEKASQQVGGRLKAVSIESRPAEERQARYIAVLLQKAIVREDVIDDAAENIELPLGTWDPSVNKWLNFSIKLIGVGLERARPALRDLQQYFDDDKFADLVQLISCSWVDYRSACRVAETAKRKPAERSPLGLNAERTATARCYVLSASGRAPQQNWKIGEPNWVFGGYVDLRKQIRAALIQAVDLTEDEAEDGGLEEELKLLEGDKQPVFVVLRTDGLNADLLRRLRADDLFAWVSFLVLTGEAGGPRELLSDIEQLEPLLPKGFETKFWTDYEKTKRSLRLR
jgi:TIR domain